MSKKIYTYVPILIALVLISTITIKLTKVDKTVTENTSNTSNISKLKTQDKTPVFSDFKDVKQKKNEFFEFIYPMVVNANIDIIQERALIEASISYDKQEQSLCKKYRIKCLENNYKDMFLTKVNVLPASLTLAQAANESSWGTSRFARTANNFFGEWCFTKGCGIVPKKRGEGKVHEVEKFKNVEASVSSYLHNLNSHPAYADLRKIRVSKNTLSGNELSHGLIKYSERAEEYVEEINSMINFNKLQNYDIKMKEYLKLENNI